MFEIKLIICIKMDLALNNLQGLICHKTQTNKLSEKKLDGNYTRILHAVLKKSWKQYPTKQQLYEHLPLISQIIQVRWIRYAEHYWVSKELISDILLWTTMHGHISKDLQTLGLCWHQMQFIRPARIDGW